MCSLFSMTEMCCTTTIKQQLLCPLNTHKQRHPIYIILSWHTFISEIFEKGQTDYQFKENMSSVSAMSFIFKCQAAPVLLSSPFLRLANVQNWYFIFLDRLLWWKRYIQWEEKETEIELSRRAFREQLLASDVTAGPLTASQTLCLQHVNCVIMHNTKAKWPSLLHDMYFEGSVPMIMQDLQADEGRNCRGDGLLLSQYDNTMHIVSHDPFNHICLQLRKV